MDSNVHKNITPYLIDKSKIAGKVILHTGNIPNSRKNYCTAAETGTCKIYPKKCENFCISVGGDTATGLMTVRVICWFWVDFGRFLYFWVWVWVDFGLFFTFRFISVYFFFLLCLLWVDVGRFFYFWVWF